MTNMIDVQIFDGLRQDMGEKFPELLQMFLKNSKIYLTTIEMNLLNGNADEILSAAHNIKSSAGLFGLTKVSASAEALEAKMRVIPHSVAYNLPALTPLCKNLQDAFSEVEGVLKAETSRYIVTKETA